MRFEFTVDGLDLGAFTAVDGLNATIEFEEFREGGENTFVHRLPGRVTYSPVVLSRPVDKHSGQLAAWLAHMQLQPMASTASITALDGNNDIVATWNLANVYPAKYTGPSFASGSAEVAIEKIELSHEGFITNDLLGGLPGL
jgi:phage tail-like protein